MNAYEKRIKIAEACNIIPKRFGEDYSLSDWVEDALPDYFNDHRATNEVEKTMTDEQWSSYVMTLAFIVGQDPSTRSWSMSRKLISATAAQRAEAVGRTLGLWGAQP